MAERGDGRCDALIIGGGHNGLVCAAYLAQAGLKVTVLERRDVVGGAAVTEEFHPGFRNSVAAYTVSLLNPKVIKDLDLHAHGLRIVERRAANFLPTADGRYLLIGGERTHDEVARFSTRDAARLAEYGKRLESIADVMRDLVLTTPPNALEGSWRQVLPELVSAARVGGRLRKLDMGLRRELLSLFSMSCGDYLDNWFESDPIKATFGFDGVVGNYASPYSPGSAYVLLHHVFGEVNGKRGAWGHAIGGMGAITQAMAKAAAARGVVIRVGTAVREVIVEGDRAVGVVTESGETLRAAAVISNLNPKLLYLNMFAPGDAAGAVPRAHEPLALRLGHVPHECGAQGAAGLHLPAGQDRRRPPHRRHHHRPDAVLHGAGLLRCPHLRLVEEADRGGVHPLDAR